VNRYRPFIIALAASWLALGVLYLALDAACVRNAGCSGEYGVIFVLLGLPWDMPLMPVFPATSLVPITIGLLANTLIFGFIAQLVAIAWRRLRQRGR
jgi:hypothetical protein